MGKIAAVGKAVAMQIMMVKMLTITEVVGPKTAKAMKEVMVKMIVMAIMR